MLIVKNNEVQVKNVEDFDSNDITILQGCGLMRNNDAVALSVISKSLSLQKSDFNYNYKSIPTFSHIYKNMNISVVDINFSNADVFNQDRYNLMNSKYIVTVDNHNKEVCVWDDFRDFFNKYKDKFSYRDKNEEIDDFLSTINYDVEYINNFTRRIRVDGHTMNRSEFLAYRNVLLRKLKYKRKDIAYYPTTTPDFIVKEKLWFDAKEVFQRHNKPTLGFTPGQLEFLKIKKALIIVTDTRKNKIIETSPIAVIQEKYDVCTIFKGVTNV